jgi:hypothetical protein
MSTRSNGVKAQRLILWALTEFDQMLKLFVIGVLVFAISKYQYRQTVTRPMLNYIKESAFDSLFVCHTLAVD